MTLIYCGGWEYCDYIFQVILCQSFSLRGGKYSENEQICKTDQRATSQDIKGILSDLVVRLVVHETL